MCLITQNRNQIYFFGLKTSYIFRGGKGGKGGKGSSTHQGPTLSGAATATATATAQWLCGVSVPISVLTHQLDEAIDLQGRRRSSGFYPFGIFFCAIKIQKVVFAEKGRKTERRASSSSNRGTKAGTEKPSSSTSAPAAVQRTVSPGEAGGTAKARRKN